MSSDKPNSRKFRIACEVIHPKGVHPRRELFIEKVRKTKGIGRWIYCKYCYENVQPLLGGINQIVCSECGYALTPDFFTFRALQRYLAGENYETIMKDDMNSEEAKIWLIKRRFE